MPKQAKAKRDGVINPQNCNFIEFFTRKFDALKTLRIDRRTWLRVPSGTLLLLRFNRKSASSTAPKLSDLCKRPKYF